MADTPEKMDDETLVARLAYATAQAVGFSESRLSKERENVRVHYEAERPHKVSAGDSAYVSQDVYESVEAMKAQLLEAALSTHRPVTFTPGPNDTAEDSDVRGEWCDNVLFNQNKGFHVLSTAIADGLMGRNGIVKAYWKTQVKKHAYDLTDTVFETVKAHLIDNPEVELDDYEVDDDGVTVKRVRFIKKVDDSQIVIEAVPPEEFGISPMAASMETAEIVFHKKRMTISELLKAGYPKKTVMALQDNERLWDATDTDVQGRFQETDDMIGEGGFDTMGKARARCTVFECYSELDIEGTGESELWRVVYCGTTILEKERVERRPFHDFCPLPREHAFWGTNYAKKIIQTQVSRTYLTRSIINHAMITNNPRLQVVRGAVLNPRELLDNRIGGLVNVTRPDGIAPIPQQGLNPYIYQTIAMLDDNKEQLTGISRLSQGLNKDAISNQNSQGMVNDLVTNSQTRQRVIVRNWCENFLRPLYTAIYQLTCENADRSKIAMISGQWKEIDFSQWTTESTAMVAISLGPQGQQEELSKWLVFDKWISSDQGIAKFYPPEKRFAVVKRIMVAGGIRDWQNYVITPDQVKPPEPDPMMLADLDVKKADAEVKRANAQAALQGHGTKQLAQQTKHQEFIAKMNLAQQKEGDHVDLETQKFHHDVAMDAANLKLEVAAQAADKLTASVSSASSN